MKKLLFLILAVLTSVKMSADGDVTVKSGTVAIFNKAAKAELIMDYSNTKVKDQTLDQYLKSRGNDFVKDWPRDRDYAREYFLQQFNRKNKKGMTLEEPPATSTPYIMVFHVDYLDMGNGAGSFIPFAGAKAGGVITAGRIEVIARSTNKVLCSIKVDEVKGVGHPSETVRLGMAYFELASQVFKVIKKCKDPIPSDEDGVPAAKTTTTTKKQAAAKAEPAKSSAPAQKTGTAQKQQPKKNAKNNTKNNNAKNNNNKTKAPEVKAEPAQPKKEVEAPKKNNAILSKLNAAHGKKVERRRKPIMGDFDAVKRCSKIGVYLDMTGATIDGRNESSFVKYMETSAKGRDHDPNFAKTWKNEIKPELIYTFCKKVNEELKDERISLRFYEGIDFDVVLKMEVLNVDDNGDNNINFLFVDTETGEVFAQITCESNGGRIGSFSGLIKQGWEHAADKFSEMLIDKID